MDVHRRSVVLHPPDVRLQPLPGAALLPHRHDRRRPPRRHHLPHAAVALPEENEKVARLWPLGRHHGGRPPRPQQRRGRPHEPSGREGPPAGSVLSCLGCCCCCCCTHPSISCLPPCPPGSRAHHSLAAFNLLLSSISSTFPPLLLAGVAAPKPPHEAIRTLRRARPCISAID